MRTSISLLLGILCMAQASRRATAQDETYIQGSVRSRAGRALRGVQVFIAGSSMGTLSNDSGHFELRVPSARARGQRVELAARAIGWRPHGDSVTLAPGPIQHDFVLDSIPESIALVTVFNTSWPPKRSRADSITLAHGQALPQCLPVDSDDGLLLWIIRSTVSDSGEATNRRLSMLPTMDSASALEEVVQVTNGPVCRRAQLAVRGAYILPDSMRAKSPGRVRVFRVRDLYLVSDPALHCGEWTPLFTFDRKWELIASVLR